jgi:hypothetical protein
MAENEIERFRQLIHEYRQLAERRNQEGIARNARFQALCTRGPIRDQQLRWHAYIDIKSVPASEVTQLAWRHLAEPELRERMKNCSLETGSADSFYALTLIIPWKTDPVSETAPFVATALEVLNRAVAKVETS